jgi:CheY-like chemotaxis protein
MQQASGCNVLVADDDWELRTILKAFIQHTYKFGVLEAKNGQAAVEIAQREKPLFVIMDLEMPGLCGVEAVRSLRDDPDTSHIPVLALSGHGQLWRDKALEAGCVHCLDKGVRFETLSEAIDNIASKSLAALPCPGRKTVETGIK